MVMYSSPRVTYDLRRWVPGCVQDQGSSLYLQCATKVDDRYAPLLTDYCTASASYIKVREIFGCGQMESKLKMQAGMNVSTVPLLVGLIIPVM